MKNSVIRTQKVDLVILAVVQLQKLARSQYIRKRKIVNIGVL